MLKPSAASSLRFLIFAMQSQTCLANTNAAEVSDSLAEDYRESMKVAVIGFGLSIAFVLGVYSCLGCLFPNPKPKDAAKPTEQDPLLAQTQEERYQPRAMTC